MKDMTPVGGANPNGTLCEYEGSDSSSSARLSIGITKGEVPNKLPLEGTVVNPANVGQYPGLGIPAGLQFDPMVVHIGTVGGVPATWYRYTAKVPNASSDLSLLAFPKHYGVLVSVANTADDVAAAKRTTMTVLKNLP